MKEAVIVSAARTAKPSIVERRNVGRSLGERMSPANTRSRASPVLMSSVSGVGSGNAPNRTASASGGVRTLNSSRVALMLPGPGLPPPGVRKRRVPRAPAQPSWGERWSVGDPCPVSLNSRGARLSARCLRGAGRRVCAGPRLARVLTESRTRATNACFSTGPRANPRVSG